ncbi:unnamed protein product [Closterium sp. Yama58-4]|nr:unnamed protein product [Closterium sp. Yama58-4]
MVNEEEELVVTPGEGGADAEVLGDAASGAIGSVPAVGMVVTPAEGSVVVPEAEVVVSPGEGMTLPAAQEGAAAAGAGDAASVGGALVAIPAEGLVLTPTAQGGAAAEGEGDFASGEMPLLLCAPPGVFSQVDDQEAPDAQVKGQEETAEACLDEESDAVGRPCQIVNWAKPRHKRGRKHKYSSLGFDPDPHDRSNLEASSRNMPVNEDQGVFERLRGVMPLVFRGRKWGKGEVDALREGVEQQVVQGMIEEAVRERPEITLDRSLLQRTIAEIKSRQLTPEAMRAAVARVDWSTVAAAFVNPANRSLGRGLHLRRTALECKLRWLNVDDPSITWGEWSEREEEILKEVAESRGLCGWEGIAEEVNQRVREEEEGEEVLWEEGGETFFSSHNASGSARLRFFSSHNASGSARLRFLSSHNASGSTRLRFLSSHNASGPARLRFLSSRNASGSARLRFLSSHNASGSARLRFFSSHNASGSARLRFFSSHNASGSARLRFLSSHNASGSARLRFLSSHNASGSARLRFLSSPHNADR